MRWDTTGREHFVYRVYDAAGRLLYVGCTVDPHKRFAHHRCAGEGGANYPQAKWWHLAVRAEWEYVGLDRIQAEYAEMEVIQTEEPLFNQRRFWTEPERGSAA